MSAPDALTPPQTEPSSPSATANNNQINHNNQINNSNQINKQINHGSSNNNNNFLNNDEDDDAAPMLESLMTDIHRLVNTQHNHHSVASRDNNSAATTSPTASPHEQHFFAPADAGIFARRFSMPANLPPSKPGFQCSASIPALSDIPEVTYPPADGFVNRSNSLASIDSNGDSASADYENIHATADPHSTARWYFNNSSSSHQQQQQSSSMARMQTSVSMPPARSSLPTQSSMSQYFATTHSHSASAATATATSSSLPSGVSSIHPLTYMTASMPSAPYSGVQNATSLTCFLVQFTSGRTDTYYMPPDYAFDLRVGDYVVVEADRGEDLGRVIMDNINIALPRRNSVAGYDFPGSSGVPGFVSGPEFDEFSSSSSQNGVNLGPQFPKRIYRLAQPVEIESLLSKVRDEVNAIAVGQYKVQEWKLPMVIIDAEYQWDRRKLTFFFSVTIPQYFPNAPTPRIDFRTLVRDLYQIYRTRIWMYCVDKDKNRVSRAQSRESFLKQLYKDISWVQKQRPPQPDSPVSPQPDDVFQQQSMLNSSAPSFEPPLGNKGKSATWEDWDAQTKRTASDDTGLTNSVASLSLQSSFDSCKTTQSAPASVFSSPVKNLSASSNTTSPVNSLPPMPPQGNNMFKIPSILEHATKQQPISTPTSSPIKKSTSPTCATPPASGVNSLSHSPERRDEKASKDAMSSWEQHFYRSTGFGSVATATTHASLMTVGKMEDGGESHQ